MVSALPRLAHDFGDPGLLEIALTHRSAGRRNNERLEFLGDAVLGMVVGEELYARFPRATEGELTRLRADLVREATLAELARAIALGDAPSRVDRVFGPIERLLYRVMGVDPARGMSWRGARR